ncbi:TRAP transporter small permease [Chelonobacter oris]|uniref:TRAP transporter small permease n=1 Tax=Chelonobacter oris TaxID=505317 RepID=UPI001269E872|nr:TRAP transporter small permease [Chelonobacter oris]
MFNKIFNIIKRLKIIIDKIISIACIFIISTMTLLVSYQVIARYIFNNPSAISEVLSRYFFIWLVLFGSAYVFGLREHMLISFIKDKFPPKTKIISDMLSELAVAVFALAIMILGGYSASVRQMWQLDSALQIPIGVIYSVIPISGGLILFYS